MDESWQWSTGYSAHTASDTVCRASSTATGTEVQPSAVKSQVAAWASEPSRMIHQYIVGQSRSKGTGGTPAVISKPHQ